MAEPIAAKPPAVQQTRAVTAASATPADLVRYALESGADLDRLERLMQMQMQWEDREARKAFDASMAEFKLNPPTILKDKHVEFKTNSGVTAYDHATIGNVVEKVVASLATYGFSHRWIPRRTEGGMMSITCVIKHKLGHSEETTLEAGLDQSGGKNSIQAMSSTVTYLERYSLLAAVGLATKDQADDDGHGSDGKPSADETWMKWETQLTSAATADDIRRIRAMAGAAFEAIGDVASWNQFKVLADKKKGEIGGSAQ
ncbi:hypothetical protein BZM27_05785 [Paraburkholderia steynii]|uniref:Uncharacterized protein n=1 Tax=Paraburkholderia steynii TaxID=1245441 RepID=A0A4R0XRJ4_9BURK|nr:hypothetical protein BZM27_05785 [Paraburkholderia steynii]